MKNHYSLPLYSSFILCILAFSEAFFHETLTLRYELDSKSCNSYHNCCHVVHSLRHCNVGLFNNDVRVLSLRQHLGFEVVESDSYIDYLQVVLGSGVALVVLDVEVGILSINYNSPGLFVYC